MDMMSKRTINEAISNVKNYTKNLRQQVPTSAHLQQSSETVLSHDSNSFELPHSFTTSSAFNKTKSKGESMTLLKETSPVHSRPSRENLFSMSFKYPTLKKEVQSENERENSGYNKSHNKIQTKQLQHFLNGSAGTWEQLNKKSGHSYTYTHLNDLDSDKLSEIDNSYLPKQQKATKFRHSKSPSKERHIEHNNTCYAEENYRPTHLNRIQMERPPERPHSDKKHNDRQVTQLLLEINRLETVIEEYKSVLLKLKHRYLEMEDAVKEKVLNDHLMDVLKAKIEDLQDRNNSMNVLLDRQKTVIGQYEQTFIAKITEIREYYLEKIQENTLLKRENELLKKLLLISTDKVPPKTAKTEPNPQPANSFLRTMAKNIDQFNSKWS